MYRSGFESVPPEYKPQCLLLEPSCYVKNLGRQLEASYLFVTNISLLPSFIFGCGFVSLHDIVSVHLFSSLLKSSASVYVYVCVYIYIYIYI